LNARFTCNSKGSWNLKGRLTAARPHPVDRAWLEFPSQDRLLGDFAEDRLVGRRHTASPTVPSAFTVNVITA